MEESRCGGVLFCRRCGLANRLFQREADFLRSSPLFTSTLFFAFANKSRIEGRWFRAGKMGIDCPIFFFLEGFNLAFAFNDQSKARRSARVPRKNHDALCPTEAATPGIPLGGRVHVSPVGHRPNARSISRGCSKASCTAFLVISLNVTRRMRSSPGSSFFLFLLALPSHHPILRQDAPRWLRLRGRDRARDRCGRRTRPASLTSPALFLCRG